MDWEVIWDVRAYKDLDAIDVTLAERIVKKVSTYLVRDPLSLGKPLSANLGGLYSYRFGDYRVIYKLSIPQKQFVVLYVGHRKNIYEI